MFVMRIRSGWSARSCRSIPILDTSHGSDYIDTTLHGGDSVGVATAGQERFVEVTPNPAATEVRVVSSVGMMQVEAYEVKGVKVMGERVTGSFMGH